MKFEQMHVKRLNTLNCTVKKTVRVQVQYLTGGRVDRGWCGPNVLSFGFETCVHLLINNGLSINLAVKDLVTSRNSSPSVNSKCTVLLYFLPNYLQSIAYLETAWNALPEQHLSTMPE